MIKKFQSRIVYSDMREETFAIRLPVCQQEGRSSSFFFFSMSIFFCDFRAAGGKKSLFDFLHYAKPGFTF